MRYFNPEWFRRNKISIQHQLNFWSEVLWWLNSYNARIKVYKNKKAIIWRVHKGKFYKHREIKFTKTGKWDVGPSRAIKDPLCYALAIRMKYLQLPRKWKRVPGTKIHRFKAAQMEFVFYENQYAIQFKDMFGHSVKIRIEDWTEEVLDYIYKKYKELVLDRNPN